MDEMTVVSRLMRRIVSGLIAKIIEKQIGCKVNIELGEFKIKFDGEKALIHLDTDAELRTADLMKLTSRFM